MSYIDDLPFDTWDVFYEEEPQIDTFQFIEIVAQTKKAILFRNEKGSFWLPKSIITIDKSVNIVSVPVWCNWTYIDDKPPPHPNPKGSFHGKSKNKCSDSKSRKTK